MKAPLINCPNCNSPQKFITRERKDDEFIVKFIACNMCREQFVVDRYPINKKKFLEKSNILRFRERRRSSLRIGNG
jgi:hypothetical protein